MALINAYCQVFNKCELHDFLEWSFQFLINNQKRQLYPVLMQFCHVHFFKAISRNNIIKIILNKFVGIPLIGNIFKFSLSLLQHSTTIDQFVDILHHFYLI